MYNQNLKISALSKIVCPLTNIIHKSFVGFFFLYTFAMGILGRGSFRKYLTLLEICRFLN
jgi:hypothetical protein